MINLDNKYHHYLGSERKFRIDNVDKNEMNAELLFENEIIGKIVSINPTFAIIKTAKFKNFIDKNISLKSNKKIKIFKPNYVD